MKLRFGSVCSGIEAASTAWEPLGWEPVFFSEIEKHPSNVLRYHWPDVPNLGDFTTIDGKAHDIDVLVGGTPCQAFSVAGKRNSLDDDRGNLSLKFVELVHDSNVPVVVWENVPGVLNTKDNAFGCFLSGLVGADKPLLPLKDGGWPRFGMVAGPRRVVAWRVFDAQYHGVAQRRRRVFLVSFRTGDGRNPGAVLFEPESLPRNTPPSRKEREVFAQGAGNGSSHWSGGPHPALSQALKSSGGIGASNQEIFSQGGAGLVGWPAEVASCLNAAFGDKQGLEDQHINQGAPLFVPTCFNWQNAGNEGLAISNEVSGPLDCSQTKAVAIHPHCIGRGPGAGPQGKEYLEDGSAYTMDSRGVSQAIAVGINGGDVGFSLRANPSASGDKGDGGVNTTMVAVGWSEELTAHEDVVGTLQHGGQGGRHDGGMTPDMQVRRLTPVECERLQGFPDNHTQYAVDENGKQYTMPNGARYKALGNSMAVPCMAWIGRRIEMVLEATEYSKAVEEK